MGKRFTATEKKVLRLLDAGRIHSAREIGQEIGVLEHDADAIVNSLAQKRVPIIWDNILDRQGNWVRVYTLPKQSKINWSFYLFVLPIMFAVGIVLGLYAEMFWEVLMIEPASSVPGAPGSVKS